MIFIKIETIGTATKTSETKTTKAQNGWTTSKKIETDCNYGCRLTGFQSLSFCV